MKINKLFEAKVEDVKKPLTEADGIDDDVIEENPVVEVGTKTDASEVKTAVETQTGGEETISDGDAAKVAAEANAAATDINAGQTAVLVNQKSQPQKVAYESVNAMTEILDVALTTAKRYMRQGSNGRSWAPEGVNVLITGLPGSGKTSITKTWAKNRGVNFIEVNAKDNSIEELIYGVKVPDRDENGKIRVNEVRPDSLIAKLHQPNSVLFLDEFNRQTDPKIRGSLLDLINKKEINTATGESLYFTDTLLFTVACINPAIDTDKGAKKLIDAEKSRFLLKGRYDSNAADTKNFLNYITVSKLADLGIDVSKMAKSLNVRAVKVAEDPTENMTDEERAQYYKDMDAIEALKVWDLGTFIMNRPDFKYDTDEDNFDLASEDKTQLNQRYLFQGLNAAGGDVKEFEKWVEYSSNLLEKDINMLLGITRQYKFEEDKLYAMAGLTKPQRTAMAAANDVEEDDEDAFAASDTAQRSSAADVESMIDDLINSF